MSVSHFHHLTLAVPDVAAQMQFYVDFGLTGKVVGDRAVMRCKGRAQDQIVVVEGSSMGLHDLSFGTTAEGLRQIERRAQAHPDVSIIDSPALAPYRGLWLRHDFDGMLYNVNVSESAPSRGGPHPKSGRAPPLANAPGSYERLNRKGGAAFDSEVAPSRLGHMVHFTTDVDKKLDFYLRVLGLKLTDRSGDFIAFVRCAGGCDHHVVAVIKDKKPGFHHASFEAASVDEMGLGGQSMLEKGYRDGWGFGRHALGSNFFWYIRDPHNGLCEYFNDIDYIADDKKWRARDWPVEVSFYLWGPPPPAAFGRNYQGTRKTVRPTAQTLART